MISDVARKLLQGFKGELPLLLHFRRKAEGIIVPGHCAEGLGLFRHLAADVAGSDDAKGLSV